MLFASLKFQICRSKLRGIKPRFENEENGRWIYKHIPECLNLIRDDEKIIGFTFIYPASHQIMEKFLSKRINEAEMFEEVKSSWSNMPIDAIYLCAAVVAPTYQKNKSHHTLKGVVCDRLLFLGCSEIKRQFYQLTKVSG